MAAMIGSNLQFNVAWLEKISFEVDTVIAERGLGFSLGRLEGSPEFFGAVHHPHAATASSCCRLNNDWISDLRGSVAGLLLALELTGASGCDRQASPGDDFPRLGLVPHERDVFRRGADELDADGFADFGKVGVFRQEAVTGMDGVGAGDFCGAQDVGNVA